MRAALVVLALATASLSAPQPGNAQPGGCAEIVPAESTRARERLRAMDERGGLAGLRNAAGAARCPALQIVVLAVDGWLQARALVGVGGDPASLGGVNGVLDALRALAGGDTSLRRPAEYASAAIRAAVAAAQDERDEMELFLGHARGLVDSPLWQGRDAWPLEIDELEGELWLEVDRYVEARAAFERAATAGAGARALVGLARARVNLNDHQGACEAYRRAAGLELIDAVKEEVRAFLGGDVCRLQASDVRRRASPKLDGPIAHSP
jgi:tetratricopeptide (TPR) repeat protein